MTRLIEKTLKEPSQSVLLSISPANYTHTDGGLIVLKNSARMRLYFDRDFLIVNGFDGCRLDLLLFSEKLLTLVFRVGHEGRLLTPISKSGRSEIGIPMSVLSSLKPDDFPKIRKAQCGYQFRDDKLFVALPLMYR